MENSNAFVDSLMIEECLKDGKQLLITDLISLAISDGNLFTYCVDLVVQSNTIIIFVSLE